MECIKEITEMNSCHLLTREKQSSMSKFFHDFYNNFLPYKSVAIWGNHEKIQVYSDTSVRNLRESETFS